LGRSATEKKLSDKLKSAVVPVEIMKSYCGMEVYNHSFLT